MPQVTLVLEFLRDLPRLCRATLRIFVERRGGLLAAATAFFGLLSASPLALISLSVVTPIVGQDRARFALQRGLTLWLGADWAKVIGRSLESANLDTGDAVATVMSVLVVTYGAAQLFSQLRSALNQLWATPRATTGFRFTKHTFQRRLGAFAMVMLCGAALLASVLTRGAITFTESIVGKSHAFWKTLEHYLSFGIAFSLFMLVYRYATDVRVAWSDAVAGAVVSGVLFQIGRTLLALYVGRAGLHSTFGAASSVVVLLLWIHYSAHMFFLGAAFIGALRERRQVHELQG